MPVVNVFSNYPPMPPMPNMQNMPNMPFNIYPNQASQFQPQSFQPVQVSPQSLPIITPPSSQINTPINTPPSPSPSPSPSPMAIPLENDNINTKIPTEPFSKQSNNKNLPVETETTSEKTTPTTSQEKQNTSQEKEDDETSNPSEKKLPPNTVIDANNVLFDTVRNIPVDYNGEKLPLGKVMYADGRLGSTSDFS
jgi:hypothetical protein